MKKWMLIAALLTVVFVSAGIFLATVYAVSNELAFILSHPHVLVLSEG